MKTKLFLEIAIHIFWRTPLVVVVVGPGFVGTLPDGPLRIFVKSESIADPLVFFPLSFLCRWYDGSSAGEGTDGGKLVL